MFSVNLVNFEMKFLIVCLFVALSFKSCFSQTPLGSYGAAANATTVSGISAGAIFAVQYHVAFSSEVMGVGCVAGVPYYCAKGSFAETTSCMYTPEFTRVDALITATDDYAKTSDIDPTEGMAGDKVYIYDGNFDTVVYPGNGPNVQQYYTNYNSDIYTEFNINSEHCMPTVDYGNKCAVLGSPYISACDYNAAYIMMNHFYGDIVEPTGTITLTGDFYEFDQTEFVTGQADAISMDTIGYAYVPAACQTNPGCRLHVAFHGCKQGRDFIGDVYARNAGYNEVAELNNIIVIYPQIVKSLTTPSNSNGCYDWWGYTDKYYATKSGSQMAAVHNMVAKILS